MRKATLAATVGVRLRPMATGPLRAPARLLRRLVLAGLAVALAATAAPGQPRGGATVAAKTLLPGTIELSALSGPNGFRLNGVSSDDLSGAGVSGAGDVNGDGFGDLVIGAVRATPNGFDSGQSYVVYGGAALPGTVELSALSGPDGFRINGITTGDSSGLSVSGAGDVNGDGFDDLLIGGYLADPNGSDSGQSYVVYGGSALPGTVELSALSGPNGFRLNGIAAFDQAGYSVSGAGDVNDDGFDDLLIGSIHADPHGTSSGQSYVVYGGSTLPGTVELSALSGPNGFRINGIAASDFSGQSVSGAGDVNGDGFDDLLIGAWSADPHGSQSGQSYVVYGGSALPGTVELSALSGADGFRINGIAAGDQAGVAVSGAGDVNGDGFDDVLIAANGADPNGLASGQSYVIYGGLALPGTVELSALSGPNGLRLNGVSSVTETRAVSGAGDVNGDGFDDLLIGAEAADPNGLSSGQSYVVYGGSALPGTVELSALSGPDGFRLNGIAAGDLSGAAVGGAGDVNGDGFDDLLIGAYQADPNGSGSGQSYLVYGNGAGDLAMTKTDGVTTAAPGGTVTYTIVVSNAGPGAESGALVTDTFPAACSVTYTSVAAGGATGNTASGTANISDTLSLPADSSVTYTAICTISPTATGTLANTATIATPPGDPTPGNNSATDTDALVGGGVLAIPTLDWRGLGLLILALGGLGMALLRRGSRSAC